MRSLVIPEGRKEIEQYEFSDIRDLEEVYIPNSVEHINRHAFYNCRSLKKVTVPGHLTQIEDGVFKNCHALTEIEINAVDYETHCIKNIVNDMTHQFTIHVHYPDGDARLLIPGYVYDYEMDINSKVFHEVVFGSGDAYQRCVARDQIAFSEYDWLYFMAKSEERPEVVFELTQNRLMYPYQLKEENKKKYIDHLKGHAEAFVRLQIEQGNQQALRLAAEYELFEEDKMEDYMELATKKKNLESVAFLMEYRNQHFAQNLIDQEFEF